MNLCEQTYINYWIYLIFCLLLFSGFPGISEVKNPPVNVGSVSLIPGLGRSLEVGNENPLQYSCLGNPMDRGGWGATVYGGGGLVTKSYLTLLWPKGPSHPWVRYDLAMNNKKYIVLLLSHGTKIHLYQ